MRERVFFVVILSLALIGCGRVYGPVEQVDAYIAVKEPLFEEMTKGVKADPTEAGVDKASKLWESKKADLKAKFDAIHAAPQGMNVDWQGVYFKSQDRTLKELDTMETALMSADTAKSQFKALRKDVETTLKLK